MRTRSGPGRNTASAPCRPATGVEFAHGPARPGRRVGGRVLRGLGVFAGVAICVLVLSPVAAQLAGYRALVVTSGSMAPDAETGDVYLLRSSDGLRRGDVITYRPLASDGLTTHRIVDVRRVGGRVHYRTKGDANPAPDVNLVPAGNVIGRVVAKIPDAGAFVTFAMTPGGRVAFVVLPASVLVVGELRRLFPGLRRRRRGARRRAAAVVTAAIVLVGMGGPAAGRFTDPTSVGANALAAGSLAPPTANSASVGLLCSITVTWSAPATGLVPTGYDLYRSTTSGGPYTFIKHVGAVTSTTDTGAILTTYHYVLRSTRGTAWTSGNSNQRSVSTGLCL